MGRWVRRTRESGEGDRQRERQRDRERERDRERDALFIVFKVRVTEPNGAGQLNIVNIPAPVFIDDVQSGFELVIR